MKILVLCYEYPPIGGGGGRVAAQVARELLRRGHEVRVQTAGMKHLPARFEDEGVEVIRSESFRRREDTCSVPEMGLYLLTSFWPALQLARRWKPDVIHAHFGVPTGVLALALHWLTGIPYVVTAHLGDVPGGVPEQTSSLFTLVNPFVRPVWKKSAKVTAVSSFVGGLAEKAYGISPVVIPNGMKLVRRSGVVAGDPPRLLFVGRLSIQKNPLLAIESLALVRDLPWHLTVIGEGPLGEKMRVRAGELGLMERIEFAGWLAGANVATRMEQADILLMTSLHEGLPMVAVEALQQGLAIVGSDIGGMRDVIDDDRNGFLCSLTAKAFAEKLRSLLVSSERLLDLKKASLAKAADFDLDRSVASYERVLLDAAGEAG